LIRVHPRPIQLIPRAPKAGVIGEEGIATVDDDSDQLQGVGPFEMVGGANERRAIANQRRQRKDANLRQREGRIPRSKG
jgi:hypothetical protein